ncbi:zinc-responsive transcriptional regulator ZAP1 [Echria macrotheca]|uniref:Zinc-responsive transcriptional regulator ZAP1 n=1 Tax=Echria macrotheca TaxID=438768 RepID=A0AAJ0F773_9PEZI|nr:zinc-responsive transcriptional regulator ZAP1 [Echria macrotheca]
MDGSFAPSYYPDDRNAVHRQSQSGGLGPIPISFSAMDLSQLPTQPAMSRLSGGAGASHDDLCLDQCTTVGVYNPSFYNHRGAPASMAPQWPTYLQTTTNLASVNYSQDIHQAMPFRPGISVPYQPWYGQRQPDRLPDDDSSSALSCCDSQCTMTGKCSNIACANKADACTDQTCPERSTGVPAEVVDGAAALISINHAPEAHNDFLRFRQDDFSFDLSHISGQSWLWPETVNNVATHLLAAHGDPGSSTCTRPCVLDNLANFSNCPMPSVHSLGEYNQFSGPSAQDFVACRAEVHDPENFLEHFNQEHKQFFTANQPLTIPLLNQRQGFSSEDSVSSSPVTPPDSADSTSSNTPSPLTPISNALDVADPKEEEMTPERGMSEISEDGFQIHRCLWREGCGSELCGEGFGSPEELFSHTASVHIKNATKGDQGFRCGWDDCPRSKPDAAGFPQRSKIERHMQTHIDHKPHRCEICQKGFSAKQALNQHMFIHTNQKPLVCEFCQKSFRYPSALTMHLRVHTGEKPLQCDKCGKRFSESSNLSKHKRTHEERGRFTCRVAGCDRHFHRQDQLRRHMKTHVKDEGPVDMLAAKFETVFEGGEQ